MNIFEEFAAKIKALDIGKLFVQSVDNKIKEDIHERITDRLSGGADVQYNKLQTDTAKHQNSKTYSKRTKQIKKDKGQPVDRVTLQDSGDFYDSIETIVDNKGFEIKADFEKTDGHIADNFTESYPSEIGFELMIIGLDSNDELFIFEDIKDNLIKQIKNEL